MVISLSLFFLVNLLFSWRQFSQLKGFKTTQIMLVVHGALFWVLFLAQLLYINDKINHFYYVSCLKTSLAVVFSVYLSLICLISIKELNKKKVQTLWRIPFLGFFAGMYFELKYTPYICIGYCAVALFIVFKERERLRYLLKYTLFMLFLAVITLWISIHSVEILNIYLFSLVLGMSPILRLANISSLLKEKL
jgi:hypothetical protein